MHQTTSAENAHDPAHSNTPTSILPSQVDLSRVKDFIVVDEDGKSRPFNQIYTGENTTPRVLIIFVRHFFCGNCQEYITSLSASITPESLLTLPIPASIAIIGCGAPSLIPDYRSRTKCAFPIYSDPSNNLFTALGMSKTLSMGSRPEYQRSNAVSLTIRSLFQNLRQIPIGDALSGGDMRQVGGEFLFEPIYEESRDPQSPDTFAPDGRWNKRYGAGEKRVTWCHRMKNTRDHAELPEVREVLGFRDEGVGGGNKKRWSMALDSRKGTGLSLTDQRRFGSVA